LREHFPVDLCAFLNLNQYFNKLVANLGIITLDNMAIVNDGRAHPVVNVGEDQFLVVFAEYKGKSAKAI